MNSGPIKSHDEKVDATRRWDFVRRLLNDAFPNVRAAQLRAADAALAGMLVLPGTGGTPIHVGNPPRWSEHLTGDVEALWMLNRMSHWPVLLRAYALTGDDRYAEKVVAELDDWITNIPAPVVPGTPDVQTLRVAFDRPTPWRMLEVGLRLIRNWRAVPRYLDGTKWWTIERQNRFNNAVAVHADVLSRFSPMLWPNADHNHFLTEMLGLLSASTLLKHLPEADAWYAQALGELERCCAQQFTAEGGQIEGCPHYHAVCVEELAQVFVLVREVGRPVPAAIDRTLRAAMKYLQQASRPNGQCVPWGDSDAHLACVAGGILSASAFGELDDLRLASTLAGADATRALIAERAWELDDVESLLKAVDEAPRSLPARVAWHRSLDQASARTDWTRDAASLFVACRSPVNNGHAHIDPGAFDFTARSKPLLVDPGRYTYREHADRYEFKSARSHNMLLVDDREPFEYRSSWGFGPQRPGMIESVVELPGRTTIVCRHENFAPAVHRRTLTLLSDGVLVVLDEISSLADGSNVQRYFHINSTSVDWDEQTHAAFTLDDDVNVALFTTPASATLLPGRISIKSDNAHPSTRLRLENASRDGALIVVTVVAPFRGTNRPVLTDLSVGHDAVRFTLDGETRTVPIVQMQ